MDVVVTSAGMRASDRRAVSGLALPSSLLMENAGRRVAEAAMDLLGGKSGRVVILCGRGSNGGDGFVAARHLVDAGVHVAVVLIGRPALLKGDARTNFTILRKLARRPSLWELLAIVIDPAARKLAALDSPALVIDALFGTGFRGAMRGGPLRAVQWMNALSVRKLAIDIPSGLDADNGNVGNTCVNADLTVTMGMIKAGLLVGQGPARCGRIVTAGLGVPMEEIRGKGAGRIRLVGSGDVRRMLPARRFDAHKHSVGKVLIFAGSVGYTGAAALTAGAAMKSGAGAVVLATPRSIYPILARKLTEVMVKPVAETPEGAFCEHSLDIVGRELEWADVIIVGPGIGRSDPTGVFLKNLLKTGGKRFLIDADGLTQLAGNNALKGLLRRNTCVLTPHTGEFSRLTGFSPGEIEQDRIRVASAFAKYHKITLILKGAPTLTADTSGNVFINGTGNKGMATAGMGDVLSGMVGAIWAESNDPAASACAGVYLHGLAGDRVAQRIGYRSLMAGDVLKEISEVIQ